ncbi:transcription termination factor 4, mitochondrial isoform X2 [Syngnathoides biaculeatus]|uniref:transcription termination factor 4, mitochondrial isoform X2 n=1 Tax=Syngnathoides biaculeatus TaxID=300417 RepID=UPI002ADD91FC|nr:transcription termination factor 4, mitochondrial isoform X2 [Syngnathoides biaculeatus]
MHEVLCMVRSRPSTVFIPLHSGRQLQRASLCSSRRNLLPAAAQNDPGSLQRQTHPELSLPCLLDMGFTHSQAEEIYESVRKARGGSAAKHCLSTLAVLFMLGLNPSSVLKLLTKCPDLYTVTESLLQQRISNLRKLGFGEGSLQRLVAHYPAILTVPVKTVKHATMFLREKCLFTVQQVTDILRDSPAVVHQDRAQLEYKFQYAYFQMGVKQAEMVKHRLFRSSLEELRQRHAFLERRGLYQTPDKNGQTLVVNPKLDRVLDADLDSFLANAADASAEEYDVFRRLLARELQEEERRYGDESGDDDDDDSDEDEDETEGKASYRNRKRKS